jgi:hypothetical protein
MLKDIVLSESLGMRIPWGLEQYQKAKQEVPLLDGRLLYHE